MLAGYKCCAVHTASPLGSCCPEERKSSGSCSSSVPLSILGILPSRSLSPSRTSQLTQLDVTLTLGLCHQGKEGQSRLDFPAVPVAESWGVYLTAASSMQINTVVGLSETRASLELA